MIRSSSPKRPTSSGCTWIRPSMRRCSAWMKRPRFKLWIGWIRFCRCLRVGAERHGVEYYPHGTLSLDAALEVKTGKVEGKTAKRHTSTEFIAFLSQLLSKARWAKHIHIVLDNLSAHKTQAVEEFLAQHPNVHFHFTPTYSSSLNHVELWFGKIQRDVIRRGVFTSVADLARKLRKYIAAYAQSARPFRWTYTDPRKRIHINEITGTAY